MKPGHLRNIETGNIHAMEQFKKDIIFDKHFTREQIRQIATGISIEILRARGMGIQPSMQEHIILSLLEPAHIFAMISKTDDQSLEDLRSVSEEDLISFLESVRSAIIEEIKKTIDLQDPIFHYIERPNREKNTITYLENGKVYKDFRYDTIRAVAERNRKALKKLYSLKGKSPYILYGLLYKDEKTGDEIQSYAKIESLDAYMDQIPDAPDYAPNNPVSAFYALRDAIRGVKFLSENGLMLTDLSPDNIGINSASNAGYLFDLDGLAISGERTQYYPGKENFYPPELYHEKTRINEKFPVYEIGMSLKELIYWYENNTPTPTPASFRVIQSFKLLANAMTEPNPKHRLTLESAEMKLTDLCQKFEAALQK